MIFLGHKATSYSRNTWKLWLEKDRFGRICLLSKTLDIIPIDLLGALYHLLFYYTFLYGGSLAIKKSLPQLGGFVNNFLHVLFN